jgi:hypothetical protein
LEQMPKCGVKRAEPFHTMRHCRRRGRPEHSCSTPRRRGGCGYRWNRLEGARIGDRRGGGGAAINGATAAPRRPVAPRTRPARPGTSTACRGTRPPNH